MVSVTKYGRPVKLRGRHYRNLLRDQGLPRGLLYAASYITYLKVCLLLKYEINQLLHF